MSKTNSEQIDSFIQGLKSSKDIYVECPSCKYISSLYHSRLFYGKSPPKDLLSKQVTQVKHALELQETYKGKYEEAKDELIWEKDEWKRNAAEKEKDWRNKISVQYQNYIYNERGLKEKIRHLKSDVAATNKEIIKEQVKKALLGSRSAIEGHIAELFPIFRKTRINPADLCALIPTSPVDFVVFDGLFHKEVNHITFLDVKKGGSNLSKTQQSIRDTIEDGKIEFKKLRVNFDNVKGHAEEES